jgi:hypothetical protein
MKIILTLIIIVICSACLLGQNYSGLFSSRPRNNIYLNLLGDASIISINYERLFVSTPSTFLSGKLGIGYNEEFQLCIFGPCSSPPDKYLTIPHHFTCNYGLRESIHFLEFGFGGTLINGNEYYLDLIIGYRIQPKNSNKLNFRIFVSIRLRDGGGDILYIPGGLSIGVSI